MEQRIIRYFTNKLRGRKGDYNAIEMEQRGKRALPPTEEQSSKRGNESEQEANTRTLHIFAIHTLIARKNYTLTAGPVIF